MPYKVVTWGTGNVGSYAVRAVLGHPELELVAHIVSSPEKSGRDVGESRHVLQHHDFPAIHNASDLKTHGASSASLKRPHAIVNVFC